MFVDLPRNTSSPLRRFRWLLGMFSVLFLFILLLSGLKSTLGAQTPNTTADAQTTEPQTLIVQFHDLPGVQFAGYLAALENGYYEDEGLNNVEFRWRNDMEAPLQAVASHQVPFATGWMAEGAVARSQGAPIVAVALMTQGSSACMMIREDLFPNLETVSSLENKTVSVWFRCEASGRAFLAKHKVDASVVTQRRETCQLFSLGYIHAMFATSWNNKPRVSFLLYRNTIRYIMFKDCGCDYPEDTLFCDEAFLRAHPAACEKFVKATFRGWLKVLTEPDSIVKSLARHCSTFGMSDDQYILKEQLVAYLSVFQTDPQTANSGLCTPTRFENMVDDLVSAGLIKKEKRPAFRDFFIPVLKQKSEVMSQKGGSSGQSTKTSGQQGHHQGTNDK